MTTRPNTKPFVIAWLLLFLGAGIFLIADESNYRAVTVSGVLLWFGVFASGLGIVYQGARFSPMTRLMGWMLLAICAIPAVFIVLSTFGA